jgi:hypothetical protein
MRKTWLALLLLAGAPIRAGEDGLDPLLDRLFDSDANVRAEARAALAAREDLTVAWLLDRIESRQAPAAVVRIFDVRDLLDCGEWGRLVAARLKRVGGAGAALDEARGTLVVRAPEGALADVERELHALRSALSRFATVSFRVVRVGTGLEWPTGPIPAAEVAPLLAQPGIETVCAPNLVCRNGDEASIVVAREVSFVSDFDVEVGQESFVADPIVSTANEGITIRIRPSIEGKAVRLALTAEVSELPQPLPTLAIPVPFASPLEIQVPCGRTFRTTALLRCEEGLVSVVDLGGEFRLLVEAAETAEVR